MKEQKVAALEAFAQSPGNKKANPHGVRLE